MCVCTKYLNSLSVLLASMLVLTVDSHLTLTSCELSVTLFSYQKIIKNCWKVRKVFIELNYTV